MGQRDDVVAARFAGDDEAQRAVEPVARGYALLLSDQEPALAPARIGGEEDGDAALLLILIHELGRGLIARREQAPAQESVAAPGQIGDDELLADALRQPGGQVLAVIGGDLDRMAVLMRVDLMRLDG